MSAPTISSNISKVLAQVRDAAEKYQRDPASIKLMAVSKTQPPEAVRAAAAAGVTDFGENYLQDAQEKIAACRDLGLTWHFIGPIQSNKTRAIANDFDWVHSVDRLKILRRLNEQRDAEKPPLNICIQVNISGESTKAGCAPEALGDLLEEARPMSRLRIRGLMAIPAPSEDFLEQRAACEALASLFNAQSAALPSLDTLSIGMSADLEAAVAAGSTMLRIGTAIFGPRRR